MIKTAVRQVGGSPEMLRTTGDYLVLPLDEDLARRLEGQADACLNGDGTCGEENRRKSCFARQHCSEGLAPRSSLGGAVRRHACAKVMLLGREFVGCIFADPILRTNFFDMFPSVDWSECRRLCYRGSGWASYTGPVVVYTLCVSEKHRGQNLGPRLIESACGKSRVYLTVYDSEDEQTEAGIRFYTRLGFERLGKEGRHILFVRH